MPAAHTHTQQKMTQVTPPPPPPTLLPPIGVKILLKTLSVWPLVIGFGFTCDLLRKWRGFFSRAPAKRSPIPIEIEPLH